MFDPDADRKQQARERRTRLAGLRGALVELALAPSDGQNAHGVTAVGRDLTLGRAAGAGGDCGEVWVMKRTPLGTLVAFLAFECLTRTDGPDSTPSFRVVHSPPLVAPRAADPQVAARANALLVADWFSFVGDLHGATAV